MTRHPCFRSDRLTNLSRARFAESFCSQNDAFALGLVLCAEHACQKHPSMNTATLRLGNTKSGRTRACRLLDRGMAISVAFVFSASVSFTCRRHPDMRCRRSKVIKAISVALFPRPRMRDMTSDRFALENTSLTAPNNQFEGRRRSTASAGFAATTRFSKVPRLMVYSISSTPAGTPDLNSSA
jgi:hypothetical protein